MYKEMIAQVAKDKEINIILVYYFDRFSRAGYEQKEVIEKFPLKRHVRCADCGGYITGYTVKAKGKDYYKCNKIGCKCALDLGKFQMQSIK